MLTRGHLIGQVVDDLSSIAAQAKQRARLHLFDIHIHVEDFIKEVLNRALQLELVNLNAERSNNPGLDLGDGASGWAFQVTADKSSGKIKETLKKISDEQKKKYPNIRVLVVGEKQKSYQFKGQPFEAFDFKADMVWDFNDVCARIMGRPIDQLMDLYGYVQRETRRVKIELEIPDEDGAFPTNIDGLVEALPKPQLSNAQKMVRHFESVGEEIEREETAEAISELSASLASLPRLTREVFTLLVKRRDEATSGFNDHFRISDPKLRRIYRGDDLDGDLALLYEAGLVSINEPDNYGEAHYWQIHLPGSGHAFHLCLAQYAEELGIDLRKPLVTLDFSDF